MIQCGELCAIHNGGVSFNSTVLGSEAVYFCNEGYMLAFGDSIRTCMDNKLWSGTEPCCVGEQTLLFKSFKSINIAK